MVRIFDRWAEIVRDAEWRNIIEVRQSFPTADSAEVESGAIVNLQKNSYRLITGIDYQRQVVAALLLTHAEYSRQSRWKRLL